MGASASGLNYIFPGMIVMTTGTCPSDFTEVSVFSGKFLLGTVAANGDVGTTGGVDTVTPSGTNGTVSFTPAGTSTGTSAGTPAGTNGTASFTPAGTNAAISAGTPAGTIGALTTGADSSTTGGVAKAVAQTPVFTGSALGTHTHTFTGSAGTVPAEVFTGVSMATHTHTFVGTPGTVPAETFTGNQFDNRPAFIKVIFCRKD